MIKLSGEDAPCEDQDGEFAKAQSSKGRNSGNEVELCGLISHANNHYLPDALTLDAVTIRDGLITKVEAPSPAWMALTRVP